MKKLLPKEFPYFLSEIPDTPELLYLRGTLPPADTKLLAVVGSRKYTEYGRSVCERLITELAPYKVAIVSGLALGIDSIAHRAALRAGLLTIAVPGSGLDDSVLYPSIHRDLAGKILEHGGALLSEFDPKTEAAPYMFPKRNRIIAGISEATLIIEAAPRSGTLITARLAADYNRNVLAVPGSIWSETTAGVHALIKDGATPVTGVEDILEALQLTKHEQKTESIRLTQMEKVVYDLLSEPLEREVLHERTSLEPHELSALLSAMEIKGIIEERLGKITRAGAKV